MPKPQSCLHIHIKLDWSEQDLFGHINNVSFFKYIQAARVNFWKESGVWKNTNQRPDKGPLLASTYCDFKKPLHYPGSLDVYSSTGEVRNSGFEIIHQLKDEKGGLVATGRDVAVYFDYLKGAKTALSEEIKENLKQYQLN
ncbi:MAG: acyl-CoA thioesterase [Owenweeksia sp.]